LHTHYNSSRQTATGCMVEPASTARSGLSPCSLCASSGCVGSNVPERYSFSPHLLVHPHANIALWLPVQCKNTWESKQSRTITFNISVSYDHPCVLNALYSSGVI